ncbi:MAG: response regulator [Myxococcota bacterium]
MQRSVDPSNRTLIAAVAASLAAVFVADAVTPLGYVEWVFYVVPIAVCAAGSRPDLPVWTAVAATGLLALGWAVSPEAVLPQSVILTNRAFGTAVVWLVAGMTTRFVHAKREVQQEAWLRVGESRVADAMAGDPTIGQLGDRVLGFLAGYAGAQVGTLYAAESPRTLRRAAAHAGGPLPVGAHELAFGESLVGQCAEDGAVRRVQRVPPGYLTIRSGLGQAEPTEIVLAPARVDGGTAGVIELGFVGPPDERVITLLGRVLPSVAVGIRSVQYRARLERLLEETQRQSEELQAQQEELRVANEELETQASALRQGQAELERQQTDLEATNVRLEEHTQTLDRQRRELVRANDDIERANRHKSEFLANMSHELRTPLNSTLILARLLADNRTANLTDEQVRFAETIYAAGNDLLTLINDVLDLSKIEAGRIELSPEPIPIEAVVRELEAQVRPIADQKQLGFSIDAHPVAITTDRQRLIQVLKNLLSNATKFTDRGEIGLRVRADGAQVRFEVTDTGIGIDPAHHDAIFEAFRQADGTTHRRYGGTGLGLSISRDLARLLGGTLTVDSAPGRGSTFVLTLPVSSPPAGVQAGAGSAHTPQAAQSTPIRRDPPLVAPPAPRPAPAPDDRATITPGQRSILVIEDDARFSQILYGLARELGFACAVAGTAEEGLRLARELVPSGIVLDVNLPDDSGLVVLERLKRDPITRHVPVHMASVEEHAEPALRMGAIGYALKPVRREALIEAFHRLESQAVERVRRILVVEDDPVQRDSICRLVATADVATDAVGSVAEALDALGSRTFDCMIIDLKLSDGTGFDLLDRLSEGDRYAFPPVIVYTGKTLTAQEEHRLREYSRSVIVKGARSPERLLDEVVLFLHQVENELPVEHQRMLRDARARDEALEGRRILVVEDDVRNVFALTSLLEPRGAKVEIARNGLEALDRLDRAPPPDLVLMDVMMPEMDGLEATRRIRQRPGLARLPIIALTAKAMLDDRDQCLAAGASDYAAKPLDVDKLLSLIRVWMPAAPR